MVSLTRLLVIAIVLAVDASNDEGSLVCFRFSVVDGSVYVTGDVVSSLSSEKSFILLISTYVLSESIILQLHNKTYIRGCTTLL